ncbi:MAG: DUF378 domain-containing protein [Alphaproteobacteria bacterium]|nr:DUF378 domain-containing protein [Alphaproteobacteria bacterium]
MNALTNFIFKPLTFIGALNWGLVGIFGFDFVAWIFGTGTLVSNIIYAVIGLSALIWLLWAMVTQPVVNNDR